MALLPTPVQRPRIPVLVAGFWPNRAPLRRSARWDGPMPVVDPDPDGSDLAALVAYYREVADEPGDLFLYVDGAILTPGRVTACADLGVSWLASDVISPRRTMTDNLVEIGRGPPP